MKKPLLAFIFLAAASSQAQTLTQANSAPAVGDQLIFFAADTSIQPGASGAGQTWTYNSLGIVPSPMVETFVTPSSTPYSSSFPTANVAQDDGQGNYQYTISSNSSLVLLGVASSQVTQTFTTAPTIYNYPFTYGSSVSNPSLAGTFTQGTITGNSSVNGDGSGTLIINGTSYNNVLRVHYHQYLDYNYTGFGHMIITIETYYWYDGSHKNAVLTITTANISGLTTGYSKQVLVGDFVTATHNLESLSFSVCPNPATSYIRISAANLHSGELKIYNAAGQEVYREQHAAGMASSEFSVSVSGLPAGLYLAEFLSDGRRGTQRFVVE